jgi:class 3 adenylate cyclase/DNA-binding NarL/FixJ family response regulator
LASARVLQVGGSEADQRTLQAALRNGDIAELVIAPVAEAIRQVSAQAVDVLLVDVMQSSTDVLNLLRAAASNAQENARVPVLMTAPPEALDRVHACLQRGAEDYLVTPYDAQNPLLATRRIELCLLRRKLRLFSVRMLSGVKDPNETAVLQVDTKHAPEDDKSEAWTKFVPREFLDNLDRKSLDDVQLGDHVQREMTVFFSDIRDFTYLSEQLTPRENFSFLTNYLRHVNPFIRARGGFIDKYLGDGVMALFPGSPESALRAAVDMLKQIVQYNEGRKRAGYAPIKIGIGLHRGSLILGTIGETERMHTTVIADAVNLASRIEGMTKTFGVQLLVSGTVVDGLEKGHDFRLRHLGAVKAKGKTQSVEIFECYDGDPAELAERKDRGKELFDAGMTEFRKGMFLSAGKIFARVAERCEGDTVAAYYRDRCTLEVVSKREPGRFDGAERMEVK